MPNFVARSVGAASARAIPGRWGEIVGQGSYRLLPFVALCASARPSRFATRDIEPVQLSVSSRWRTPAVDLWPTELEIDRRQPDVQGVCARRTRSNPQQKYSRVPGAVFDAMQHIKPRL